MRTGCVLAWVVLSALPATPASHEAGGNPVTPSFVSLEHASLEDQLNEYCHTYLLALATLYGTETPPAGQMFRVNGLDKNSSLTIWLSNVFQPTDSRFHSNYTCRFHIHVRGKEHPGSLQLLLVRNRAFAEHTQWKRIQIINHGEVVDSKGDRYYVVVKYLEVDDRFLHVHKNPDSPFFTKP